MYFVDRDFAALFLIVHMYVCILMDSLIYIYVGSWIPTLFKGQYSVTVITYFDLKMPQFGKAECFQVGFWVFWTCP